MKKTSQRGSFALWFIIVLAVVIGAGSYFYYSMGTHGSNVSAATPFTAQPADNNVSTAQSSDSSGSSACNQYLTASDINGIFGFSPTLELNLTYDTKNGCKIIWTTPQDQVHKATTGEVVIQNLASYNLTMGTTIKQDCTAMGDYGKNLNIGDFSCGGEFSDEILFTVGNNRVELPNVGTESDNPYDGMFKVAQLVASRLK